MKIGAGPQKARVRLARLRGAGLGIAAVGLIVCAGCGGGGGGGAADTNTLHGSLDTSDQAFAGGDYVDFYVTTAASDGTATVEMDSDKVDSLLLVGVEDGSGNIQTVASDDNSAGGRNAKVTFTVTRGSLYHLAATTSGSSPETGSYTLVYSGALGTLYSDPATKANLRRMQLLKK